MKVIVYEKEGVTYRKPAGYYLQGVFHDEEGSFEIDGIFMEALNLDGTIDLEKAKEIQRQRLRNFRSFEETDRAFIEALSQDKDLTSIKARMKYLRDLPADPRIDAATNINLLKNITIADWVRN